MEFIIRLTKYGAVIQAISCGYVFVGTCAIIVQSDKTRPPRPVKNKLIQRNRKGRAPAPGMCDKGE